MARSFLLGLWALCLFSCSLTYQSEDPDVSHVPELVFSDAHFVSYEDGKVSIVLEAGVLEQYQDHSALYGSQIRFASYDKEGKLSAEGRSQMISANSSDKLYSLLGGVEIESFEEDVLFQAESISWDGRSEQLVTGTADIMHLTKGSRLQEDGGLEAAENAGLAEANNAGPTVAQNAEGAGSSTRIEMEGSGFSASGITMSFQFSGPVSGTIHTSRTGGERK